MLLMFKTQFTENFDYPKIHRDLKIIFKDENNALQIRNMSLEELVETRINFLIPAGWPGIKYTLAATYATDQNGFYLLEKDGKKIASIAVAAYPEINFAYIGFYVVIPPLRHQGYGKLLISKTIEYTATKRNITCFGLNCIDSLIPMYQKHGFKTATTDYFWKYTQPQHAKATNSTTNTNIKITELSNIDTILQDLVAFDASVFGTERLEFLRNFLTKPNTLTIIAQDNGKIQGYGVISEREPAVFEEHKSYKIAPLYANNNDIANCLLEHLLAIAKPNESIYLETPGNNIAAKQMPEDFGFEKIGSQAKMFKGSKPKFDATKIFCYSSIAIGV
jgi:ribosomal protein S18 acetylase RimI-like enzyme